MMQLRELLSTGELRSAAGNLRATQTRTLRATHSSVQLSAETLLRVALVATALGAALLRASVAQLLHDCCSANFRLDLIRNSNCESRAKLRQRTTHTLRASSTVRAQLSSRVQNLLETRQFEYCTKRRWKRSVRRAKSRISTSAFEPRKRGAKLERSRAFGCDFRKTAKVVRHTTFVAASLKSDTNQNSTLRNSQQPKNWRIEVRQSQKVAILRFLSSREIVLVSLECV